jgi:iron(III) transport system substrate-binding protein
VVPAFLAEALFFSAFAQGADRQDIIDGAKKEGEVVFYAGMTPSDLELLRAKFQERYPFVKLKVNRVGGGKMLSRVLTESRAGKHFADVIQTNQFDLYTFRKSGVLDYYLSPEDGSYPNGVKDRGYWTSYQLLIRVVAYNTKLVSGETLPKTYQDLLHPRWKNAMILDPTKEEWLAGMLQIMGREKGLQYMRQLSTQNVMLRDGNALRSQLVAAGEAALDINMPTHTLEPLKKAGAPVDWTAPGPVPASMNGVAMATHAHHPNAAKLLVDFVLSKEGQQIVHDLGRVVTRSDFSRTGNLRNLTIVPVDPAAADNIQEYAKILRDIFVK